MEAIVAVVRPRHPVTAALSVDFRLELYDILLVEMKMLTARDRVRTMKQLPATNILLDDEPSDALTAFLYRFTGGDNGGITGKRAVFVPPVNSEVDEDYDLSLKGTLYCISIGFNENLNPFYAESLPSKPAFYSLDEVFETLRNNMVPYHKQTRGMLQRLYSWLQEKHNVPGAISLLFSPCSKERLLNSVTSPAYVDSYRSSASSDDSVTLRTIANEALAKMLAINKCEMTTINQLLNSDLTYKCRVNKNVVNKYWGLGAPDYSRVLPPPKPAFISETAERQPKAYNKQEDYPLHNCAASGDADGILRLLDGGWSVTQKDADSYTPIHYAAKHGHIKAVTVLLNAGNCSPNVVNGDSSTPLHLAALHGKVYVVELLLSHRDIDVNALNKNGQTALDLCERNEATDWQAAANLLRFAMSHPTPTIQVFLMDGSSRQLSLVSNINTSVQQLHQQMIKVLGLPENCGHLFTLWICSRNLQLQLKPEHKPIQHLKNWKSRIVVMFTDQDPTKEDPQLFWRRDAILSIEMEKKIRNPVAINLLFLEAYHNYIKCLYPCADKDATVLAGILMQLRNGDYDPAKVTINTINDEMLQGLIPPPKLVSRTNNWPKAVHEQYKHYSHNLSTRDRTVTFTMSIKKEHLWNCDNQQTKLMKEDEMMNNVNGLTWQQQRSYQILEMGDSRFESKLVDYRFKVLQNHFLIVCWNLTAYGSAFFTGYINKNNRTVMPVYIGVNDIGLHIITVETKAMWKSFTYRDIEWSLQRNDDRATLEVKSKGLVRQPTIIFTKQAGLIDHLMSKLAQLNTETA